MKKVVHIKIPTLHPVTWAIDLLDGQIVQRHSACVILCGCWALWTERNARSHSNSMRSVQHSVRWAIEIAGDLANLSREKFPKPIKTIPQWQPPDQNRLKINVDAYYSELKGHGGTGLALRNHDGMLIMAQALWYEYAASARAMEAYAVRDAVRLMHDLGIQEIEMESDAKDVVDLLNSSDFGRSDIAVICQEIKELCEFFTSFILTHVKRGANEVAHRCAHQASEMRRRCLWINYVPTFLRECIARECNRFG